MFFYIDPHTVHVYTHYICVCVLDRQRQSQWKQSAFKARQSKVISPLSLPTKMQPPPNKAHSLESPRWPVMLPEQ